MRRAAGRARSARARPAAGPAPARLRSSPAVPDHLHAARVGRAHAERAAGDALDSRVQAPGARLELQLPVLDLERAAALLLAVELGKELAGLVLGGDEPERADDENQEEEEVQLRHASGSCSVIRFRKAGSRGAAVRSATRSLALRA